MTWVMEGARRPCLLFSPSTNRTGLQLVGQTIWKDSRCITGTFPWSIVALSNLLWCHLAEFVSAYLCSALDDDALEPAKSILLTDVTRGVPIVSLRQKCIRRLGYPYSECRHSTYSMLHYRNYTRNQCLFECLMERVHAHCDCSAPYFPVELTVQK